MSSLKFKYSFRARSLQKKRHGSRSMLASCQADARRVAPATRSTLGGNHLVFTAPQATEGLTHRHMNPSTHAPNEPDTKINCKFSPMNQKPYEGNS